MKKNQSESNTIKDNTSDNKSQKRVDRQKRRKERRIQKIENLLSHDDHIKHDHSVVDADLSCKDLGKSDMLQEFLFKNIDVIIQWLSDYETLWVMANNYGIWNFDRLKPDVRNRLMDQYVQVSEFISIIKGMRDDIRKVNLLETADKKEEGNQQEV